MEEAVVEPEYEYEAPHFFDFSHPNHEQDGDQPDAWFGRLFTTFNSLVL